ncbi:bifunctional N(6)-L-threonylcarbamoyladenine synthase/serine/threonine protein kinase [Methanocaldococcus indicus]|uniref:bifunctional N(6)-L-threonylcarbamoyladenine synthase/serine/threonine protein kinase n=1 Tax=Methanocaldococcus indicus TaxID=213231 RepID=UPI003C6DAC83
MICLGLEGTAEKTGVGIITDEGEILFNKSVIYTPPKQGINPRKAADHHAETFPKLIEEAFEVVDKKDIDLIAFSQGPGLGPSLRVTATAARALALSLNKPIIGVNHCISHIEIGKLTTKCEDPLTLYVSGGNTQVIAYVSNKYRVFGETLDIAVGNCLDQLARHLSLPHPGGPYIEELAKKGKKLLELPYTVKGMDVAFSGLLTACKNAYDSGESKEDVCFSLQEYAFAMLTEITERALSHTNKGEVLLVGGVAVNKRLQEMIKEMAKEQGADFYIPPREVCGDNGVMIAWLGILEYKAGKRMNLEDTKIMPYYRTDMVDVVWIKNIKGKKRELPKELIGKGAEANIRKEKYLDYYDVVIKERIKKSYRHKDLDERLRKGRTNREAKLLALVKDLDVKTPYVFDVDLENKKMVIEYIKGKVLKDIIEKDIELAYKLGKVIGTLHKNNIVHNDLTTSNVIVKDNQLYIIDFGLAKITDIDEDKAIDLIVFKKALQSTHYYRFEEIWDKFLKGYKEEIKNIDEILKLMEDVEKRKRYVM